MRSSLLRRRMTMGPKEYIVFADPVVEAICVANWSSDGVGLTKADAAAVTSQQFGTTFQNNTNIVSFDELQYFTGVTQLAHGAFKGCSSLADIDLRNMTSMGNDCFKNCVALHIDVNAPLLRSIGYNLFQYSGLAKVSNLGTITTLGYYSFADTCLSLTEVWLPETLSGIANFSFWGCTSLRTIVIKATTPPTLGGSVFTNNPPDQKIYVPYSADHSVLTAYQSASGWDDKSSQIYELNPDGTIPT